MGKNLRQQRRGRGGPRYRSPSHRYLGKPKYLEKMENGVVKGIVHAPGRKTPLAVVDVAGEEALAIPGHGTQVGKNFETMMLKDVPEGTKIFNMELAPGDGGRLCRSSGAFAIMITRGQEKCVVLLPSKKKKTLPAACRATLGVAAASGRKEKPFMKAGRMFYAMKAANRLWPHTRGVAMNAVDHPFGGQTRPGKHKTVSRHMPPGKKVGSISPKRTGKRK